MSAVSQQRKMLVELVLDIPEEKIPQITEYIMREIIGYDEDEPPLTEDEIEGLRLAKEDIAAGRVTHLGDTLIALTDTADKCIANIPQHEQRHILVSIARLHERFAEGLRLMKGRDDFRLRVGGWRIILSVNFSDCCILVKYVDTRGDVYKH